MLEVFHAEAFHASQVRDLPQFLLGNERKPTQMSTTACEGLVIDMPEPRHPGGW